MSPLDPDKPSLSSDDRLLDELLARRVVTMLEASRARSAQLSSSRPLVFVLMELGLVEDTVLAEAISQTFQTRLVALTDYPDDPLEVEGLEEAFLKDAQLLPFRFDDEGLVCASPLPPSSDTQSALEFLLGCQVEIRTAVRGDFDKAFLRLYDPLSLSGSPGDNEAQPSLEAETDDVERLKDIGRDAPVVRLVSRLLTRAIELGGSDIHFEPTATDLRVRFRIDGVLQLAEVVPRAMMPGVVSRLKILAQLNIAERRLPQDGRSKTVVRGRDIDLRVSTLPVVHGEGIVLRILDRANVGLDFASLGFDPINQRHLRDMIAHPDGIVLVTGPTGSGKTTTLYAALSALQSEERKLFTVEDPVEYQLQGVSQIQVNTQTGLGFARSLRAILRQDPDIIMIGEIRDAETAHIAAQAALTGHLVLSTVHTNSACATVTRLLDMGLEDFLLASTLRGVVAQRLVRTLCTMCASPYVPDEELLSRLGYERLSDSHTFQQPVGCDACNGTGYRGRTTIQELLPITARLRAAILRKASEEELGSQAEASGMQTLFRHGLAKAATGITSIEEVLRIVGPGS